MRYSNLPSWLQFRVRQAYIIVECLLRVLVIIVGGVILAVGLPVRALWRQLKRRISLRTIHPRRISGLFALATALVAVAWLGTIAQHRRAQERAPVVGSIPMLPTTSHAAQPTPFCPTTLPHVTPIVNVDQLRVHFIDVGQGDGILIQAPDGTTVVIDGGYNNGRELAYLQALGITHVNMMVASHPHADHIGGLVEVMQALPVDQMWTPGATHTTYIFERFLDTIAAKKIPYYEAAQGDTIRCGELAFEVLDGHEYAADLNDTSLVLRLRYKRVSFLFTGDAEVTSEREMLRTVPTQLAATVLKVGHHGSYTSSSPAFLAAVHPEVAVYSAGAHNSYGHPHAETLRSLEAVEAKIYGTDVHGTVVITSDGEQYTVQASKRASSIHP